VDREAVIEASGKEDTPMAKRRGHNEGSFYVLPNGKWRGAITAHLRNGTVARRYMSGSTKKEVMDKAARIREQAAAGVSVTSPELTLDAYMRRYTADVIGPSRSRGTVAMYETVRARVAPDLGGLKLSSLTPELIQECYGRLLRRGYAAGTVRTTHAVVHGALRHAVTKWRMLPFNPADGAEPPRRTHTERRWLTYEEFDQLQVAGEAAGDRLSALWVLAFTTGMRIGEATGLMWPDIDIEEGWLQLRRKLSQE
jgi:hypothetical protein